MSRLLPWLVFCCVRCGSALDGVSSAHEPQIPPELRARIRKLAEIAIQADASPRLSRHARSLLEQPLDSLTQQFELNELTVEVVVSALESLSTEEQISQGVWLTQEEIDRVAQVLDEEGNVVYHEVEVDEIEHTPGEYDHKPFLAEGPAFVDPLAYSDVDNMPPRWRVNNQVHYCFETTGEYALSRTTIHAMRSAIVQAQQEINALGDCLAFIEREDCDPDIETLRIGKYDASSCWVSSDTPAKLNLGWCNSLIYKGSMIHELGHVLGLGHEHKRPDRDSFIHINTVVVPSLWLPQYEPYLDADTHRPYDYDSLMHYAASFRGRVAIQTPAHQSVRIGRRTGGFDGNDASQIRQIYSCAVPFAGNPSAVKLASGFGCPSPRQFIAGDDPDTCVKNVRASGSTCSVIQFKRSTLACSCCDSPINAAADADVDLYQVYLGNEFPEPPTPPAMPPFPPGGKPSISFDFSFPSSSWSIGPRMGFPTYAMTRQKGNTPSSATGPSGGPNGPDSWYYFAETSYPRELGDVFVLWYDGSGCRDGILTVEFSYSMYGATIGTLSVVASSSVWSKSGNLGSEWQTATVDLGGATNFHFMYVRGVSFSGDAAVGAVTVKCKLLVPLLSPPPSAPRPPTLPPPLAAQSLSFDFSMPRVGWFTGPFVELRTYPMTRQRGATSTMDTGPHEGPTGPYSWYYYAEADHRSEGDVFVLWYDGSGCPHGLGAVDFSYSMYGETMGTLSVVGSGTVWSKSGNQGSEWHSAAGIQLGGVPSFRFRYVRGSSITGDAAVGAVTVSCVSFSPAPPSLPPPSSPPPPPRPPPPSSPELLCEDVMDNDADGYTCHDRIKWLENVKHLPPADARSQVAEEFPRECGPCARSRGVSPSPSPSPPSEPSSPALPLPPSPPLPLQPPTSPPPQPPTHPVTCDEAMDMLAGDYTCGARILWLEHTQGKSHAEARAQVASEFPNECGPCAQN